MYKRSVDIAVPHEAQSSLVALAVVRGFLTEADCDEARTAAMVLVVRTIECYSATDKAKTRSKRH
jgi:hypothetical protein